VNSKSIKFLGGYILIFLLYVLVYTKFIVIHFGYMGYRDSLSFEKLLASLIILAIILPVVNRDNFPLNFFFHLIIGLILIPSLVIFAGSDLPYIFAAITTGGIIIIALSQRLIKLKPLKMPIGGNLKPLLNTFIASSILLVLLILSLGGAKYFNLNFSLIYEFRDDAADNLPGIFAYIIPLITKIFIPFGVIISIYFNNWLKLLVLLICAFILFGLTAHKSIIFYPVIALLFYRMTKAGNQIKIFIFSLFLIGLISFLEFILLEKSDFGFWFSSLIFRRALLTPSLLNWYYIDWFFINDLYYWAESRFTFGLISPPSYLSSAHLIGYNYFGSEDMSANTGWIGSGFANAKFFGVAAYSIAIGLLISFLNSYSKKIDPGIIISFFSVIFLTIILSTDFTTSLITHGLIFNILLLIIVGGKNIKVSK